MKKETLGTIKDLLMEVCEAHRDFNSPDFNDCLKSPCHWCEQATKVIEDIIMDDEKKYPCKVCGVLRSKEEGGTVFTVCDKCWENHFKEGKE